jgi:hypothetical protein
VTRVDRAGCDQSLDGLAKRRARYAECQRQFAFGRQTRLVAQAGFFDSAFELTGDARDRLATSGPTLGRVGLLHRWSDHLGECPRLFQHGGVALCFPANIGAPGASP